MSTRTLTLGGAAALIVLVAVIALANGGDDGDASSAAETDGAFITTMIPHHESAIEMAEVALERGERPEIRELAEGIVAAQDAEIAELDSIHRDLFGTPAAEGEHGTLGMGMEETGMDMEEMGMEEMGMEETGMEGEMAELESAEQFDRTFIDMMVPHHQSAIRMARVELESGEDPRLMRIADAIVAAQSGEIEQMNAWREKWYGEPSPAGGVPAEGEAAPSNEEMGR